MPQEGWDASLSIRIAGYHGTKTISAVSFLTVSDFFACDTTGQGYILLTYADGRSALVDWQGADGAVWMTASFLPEGDPFEMLRRIDPDLLARPIPLPEIRKETP